MNPPAKIRQAGLLFLLLPLSVCIADAAELREIEVEREEGQYRVHSESWLNVTPEVLFDVLSNHDLFTQFTGAMAESRNLEPDEQGRPQFFSRFEGCVLWFCQSFVRQGYLELTPHTELIAVVDPQKSDFKESREKWTLSAKDGGTLMLYEFQMTPDFWVPPVVGPFFMKRVLKTGGEKAVVRIEALARGEEMPL